MQQDHEVVKHTDKHNKNSGKFSTKSLNKLYRAKYYLYVKLLLLLQNCFCKVVLQEVIQLFFF